MASEQLTFRKLDVCRLDSAPIGLFMCNGELCLKTKYREPNGAASAFIVETGEFFWGPSPQSVANQNACDVTPLVMGRRTMDDTNTDGLVERLCMNCRYYRDLFCQNPDAPYGGKIRLPVQFCHAFKGY